MSGVQEFSDSIRDFHTKSSVDRLLLLAWYLEAVVGKTSFAASELRDAFRQSGSEPPNVGQYLDRLAAKKPPQLIRAGGGYRLSGGVRREMDKRVGVSPTTVAVSKLLTDLPAKVPSIVEREFLSEALNCYRAKAYRASIVMTWNLAYDHLVEWVLSDPSRLDKLNSGIAARFPKKALVILDRDGFLELKESELIGACSTGKVINKNIAEILESKLKRRNIAAHPSAVVVTQAQADDAITDLINNVVLALRR